MDDNQGKTQVTVTILVVEDSPTQLAKLRYTLEESGYSVVAATNGREGLAVARSKDIDLVISDIVMPEMDGYELCKELRADKTLRYLPVILLTSLADPRDVIKGLESGANNFICKPYDDVALLARIRNVLANQEIRKESTSEMGISIFFAGQRFFITADRLQILDLLLSTYESAISRNSELVHVRDELRLLNESLEMRVAERTAELAAAVNEQKRLRERENHLNRVLRAISNVNQLIVREKDPTRLIEQTCEMLVETRGYRATYIALNGQDGVPSLMAQAGWGEAFDPFRSSVGTGNLPDCWEKALVAKNGLVVLDPCETCGACPLWKAYKHETACVVRLRHGERDFGVLGIYFASKIGIDDDEVSLIIEVSDDLGQALHAIENDMARMASDEKLRVVAKSALDAVILADGLGNIAYWNPAAERMFGYSEDEVLGRDAHDLLMPERYRPLHEKGIKGFRQSGTGAVVGKVVELTARHKDGHEVPVEMAVSSLTINNQVWASAIVRDITQRKRAEDEMKRLQAQMIQSQRLESIGTLASGVAHEINNPLNIMMNYADLIKDDLGTPGVIRGYAGTIVSESERIAAIVRNLLAFSRHEKESHSPADVATIVNNTFSLVRTFFRKDHIELITEVPEGLPKILCRSQQIQQVLMNLLTNARDAVCDRFPGVSIDKVIKVTACLFERDDAPWIRLTVEDKAGGIPPDIADRVFDPFFTTKPKDKGTGLGLSISYGLIKEHGGDLWFESQPGTGTRFHIELLVDNGWLLSPDVLKD